MKFTYVLLSGFVSLFSPITAASAVVNETKGMGRFGDQAIAYFKAKWASYQRHLPLLYTPIEHSQEFALHTLENHYSKEMDNQFDEVKLAPYLSDVSEKDDKNILYTVNYSFLDNSWPGCYQKKEQEHFNEMFKRLRAEKPYYQEIKRMMEPVEKNNLIKPPPGVTSIAVHVRTGGDFESAEKLVFSGAASAELLDKRVSKEKGGTTQEYLRFVPLEWYGSQIASLAKLLTGKLYVYIFTDDSNPQEIVEFFKHMVSNKRIIWDYRAVGNRHDAHVAQDLWSMAHFDCLIRPWSQFSRIAEFLGDHKIVAFPVEHVENEHQHIITSHICRIGSHRL